MVVVVVDFVIVGSLLLIVSICWYCSSLLVIESASVVPYGLTKILLLPQTPALGSHRRSRGDTVQQGSSRINAARTIGSTLVNRNESNVIVTIVISMGPMRMKWEF